GRPDVFISLKGQMATPRRTIDVSALASWLMLRAVERETKRIEKLEAERHESALAPALQPAPQAAPPPPSESSQAPSQATSPTPAPAPVAPSPPAAPQTPPPSPPARSQTKPTHPEALRAPRDPAPTLPPPIEIRPLPGAGRPARGPRTGSVNTDQPPSPPMPIADPPPKPGILDQLFESQR